MAKKKRKKENGKGIQKPLWKVKVKRKKVRTGQKITGYKEKVAYDESGWYVKKVPIETPTYKKETEVRITSPALKEASERKLKLPKLKKYGKYLVSGKRHTIRIGR
ncbi:MAG: hypothetical protein CMC55_00105 [Flavobacteriaceae bacterium]|nr:hypothetical protein [Flavobacteriaceae bacterium]